MMRIIVGAVAILLLSGLSMAAQAQQRAQVPRGSYRGTCYGVQVQGDVLSAVCQRQDGRWQRAILRDVDNCVGDIGNNNGVLGCNRRGGGPTPPAYGQGYEKAQRCARLNERQQRIRGQLSQTPSWDQDKRASLRDRLQDTRERYQRIGCDQWYGTHRELCRRLSTDQHRVRERLEHTPTWDRDGQQRLNYRLGELRTRYRNEGCVQWFRVRRERCDWLSDRVRRIRGQLQQTPSWDQDRREQLRGRLHEARERSQREGCSQGFREQREHRERCEQLRETEQDIREKLERTPFWKPEHRAALSDRLNDVRQQARNERCGPR